MAESAILVMEDLPHGHKKLQITWVSAAGGTVSQAISAHDYTYVQKLRGMYLVGLVTNPGAAAPTADYDITLLDKDGADLLGGAGVDRHTSASERAVPSPDGTYPWPAGPIDGDLTFTIAAAGDTKGGVATLYFRDYA